MSLAEIAEGWMRKLAVGEIRYDPRRVESRWLTAPTGSPRGMKVIFNAQRKDRLEKPAA